MKVSIAIAQIHNPRMLVLNEPFTNLDIDIQESLKALLLQLHEKKTMFITSHNLDILVDICGNFLIMDNGTIIAEIQKTDHNNIDDLKEKIRQKLSKRKHKLNFQWLQ
jgi:ABC-2 type transport system ATP-binding protein